MPAHPRSGPKADPSGHTRCSRCGAEFACGQLSGADRCWCAELPPLAPVTGLGCLCRTCLEQALTGSKDVTR